MGARVKWAGSYPVEFQGRVLQPGEEIVVEEEIAADLCREGRQFERVRGRAKES